MYVHGHGIFTLLDDRLVSCIADGASSTATLVGFCFDVCDIIKCVSNFAGNGYIWNIEKRYLAGMPDAVIQAVKLAHEKGLGHLTASSLQAAMSGTAILVVYALYKARRSNLRDKKYRSRFASDVGPKIGPRCF